MRVTLAQINPVVGDIKGNLKKIKSTVEAYSKRTDLIIFPELSVSGYPPRDLLESGSFIEEISAAVEELREFSNKYHGLGILIGAPRRKENHSRCVLYNAAILVSQGEILAVRGKTLLPHYDVFDESRYFVPFPDIEPVEFGGRSIGITICEDIWPGGDPSSSVQYATDPVTVLKEKGADIIINIAASPFYAGKLSLRYEQIQKHIKKHSIPFIFLNQVGGNDELIFDGSSSAYDSEGRILASFPSFIENTGTIDMASSGRFYDSKAENEDYEIYSALALGLKDYMKKCGFSKAVIGISGGIDSSLVAAIASDAIGADNILGVALPSEFTSKKSFTLADELAENLGIKLITIPITEIYSEYQNTLSSQYISVPEDTDITYQNIQARIRGNILMAFSNRYNYLLLTTGNKSETAVGYSTLYGDLAGGLAILSDIPKTRVYRLAEYLNREKIVIPEGIISRAPTAELKSDQKDQDTLPPYDILDGILSLYIEGNMSVDDIIAEGYEKETVVWVARAVKNAEYKRRQAPLGLKVTSKAFGSGRRMPIAARY